MLGWTLLTKSSRNKPDGMLQCHQVHSIDIVFKLKTRIKNFEACKYKELMLVLGTIPVLRSLSGSVQSYPTRVPSRRTVF